MAKVKNDVPATSVTSGAVITLEPQSAFSSPLLLQADPGVSWV